MTPCSIVIGYQRFRGLYHGLNLHRRENLKSRKILQAHFYCANLKMKDVHKQCKKSVVSQKVLLTFKQFVTRGIGDSSSA
jgi:hypothetical protein